MGIRLRALASLGAMLGIATTIETHAATAQIDASATQQVIRGFGGATVFQPPGLPASLSPTEMDLLFGNAPNQIGLTLLRIRVASDDAWRAIELAHAQGALARGAQVIATPWSPPAAMKDNNSIIGGALLPSAYADYAKYLNDFATYMANNGAPLYAISVQNEPDISVTYESCVWTSAQMLAFCKNNAGAVTATKLIAPESFQFRRNISDPLLNDDTAAANVDIVGGHIYGAGLLPYSLAVTKGKEVWMTEHYDNQATDWAGAIASAKEIHDCLATANFSAYIWWYLRRFYGPLGEDDVVTKRGWAMAQFSKFIRPGYVRITATANPATGVFVSAYKRDKLVIVAINQNAAPAVQTFAIANATVNTVASWYTSSDTNVGAQTPLPVAAGSFTAILPAQSVTTFVGDLVFAAPTIAQPPQSHDLTPGSTAVLDVGTTGEFLSYQWSRNGVVLPGATNRLLTLSNVSAANAGSYTVKVTNSGGTVTSAAANIGLLAPGRVGRLTNISARALTGPGDNIQIAGFLVGGTASKQILIRAAGPALTTSYGLTALDDPAIEVHDARTNAIVASNDNWDASLEPVFASFAAFAWQRGSKDAALRVTLPPGVYTATVHGRDATTALTLVELYDADSPATGLPNMSSRALIGAGDNIMIGGFVLIGDAPQTVVLRATGATLHKLFGVTGALSAPVLELRKQGQPDPIATSDTWTPDLSAHFAKVGAFAWPNASADAAIVTTLEPGGYSVFLRGKGTATGVALVEIYAEP